MMTTMRIYYTVHLSQLETHLHKYRSLATYRSTKKNIQLRYQSTTIMLNFKFILRQYWDVSDISQSKQNKLQ